MPFLSPSNHAMACALRRRVFALSKPAAVLVRSAAWRIPLWAMVLCFAFWSLFLPVAMPLVWSMGKNEGGLGVVMGRLSHSFPRMPLLTEQGFFVVVHVMLACAAFTAIQFSITAALAWKNRPANVSAAQFGASLFPLFFFPPELFGRMERACAALNAWAKGERQNRQEFARSLGWGAVSAANLVAIGLSAPMLLVASGLSISVVLSSNLLLALGRSKSAVKKLAEKLREEGQEDFSRQERAALAQEAKKAAGSRGASDAAKTASSRRL